MKMVLMSVKAQRLSLLACLLAMLVATGCAALGPASTASTRNRGEVSIVTAFYPLQFVAERVAGAHAPGAHATVSNLTQPGAEPHDVELTPRQVASLTTASLVLYEKGFQPAVDAAVLQSENPQVIDTTTIVPLRPLAGSDDDLDRGQWAAHDHEALDPHVWLDPTSLIRISRVVENRLSIIDSDHAQEYARNADTLNEELRGLDRSFREGLSHCVRNEFITTHAAFGYLARRYHLTQIPITGLNQIGRAHV